MRKEKNLVSVCPACNSDFSCLKTRLISEQDKTNVLHMTCIKCSRTFLTMQTSQKVGENLVGMMTDLSYDDVVRTQLYNPITIDDVINTHVLLSQNKKEVLSGGGLDLFCKIPHNTRDYQKKYV